LNRGASIWQNRLRSAADVAANRTGICALLSWLINRIFPAKEPDPAEGEIPRYIDEKRAKAIRLAALYEESRGAKGAPQCPRCGAEMTLELAPSGSRFWGCTEYPACKATRKA
jgi:hypothetical protein